MKPRPESSTQEVLAGLVERVTFHNAENGFCVLRAKARGHRDVVTVVGHAATIAAGEWITASGEWVNDRTHGQQFKARFLRTSPPTSVDGIEKYLLSGMIRGVGPVYAKKLLRAFGEKVFDRHFIRRRAGSAPHRNVPAGRAKPHHHQRPSHQPGFDPRSQPARKRERLLFVQADDPETAVGRIIELVKTRIPKRFGLDPIRDIQVLCPMNRGGVGARSLNIELQAALNPAGNRKVERFGWAFAPGDKVMQIENDYDKEVYNGDIGYIDDCPSGKAGAYRCSVSRAAPGPSSVHRLRRPQRAKIVNLMREAFLWFNPPCRSVGRQTGRDAATRPASTNAAGPTRCAPRWRRPSSARLARPAACRA